MTTKAANNQRRRRPGTESPARPTGSVHLVTDLPSARSARFRRWLRSPGLLLVVLLAMVGVVLGLDRPPSSLIASEPVAEQAASVAVAEQAASVADAVGTAAGEPPAAANPAATVISNERASRFVDTATTRVLDTRTELEAPVGPGESVVVDLSSDIGADTTAVVLSVNIAMAQGPGTVTVALDRSPVTALTVGPTMATNLVIVERGDSSALTVTTEGGGHLVVDVVGHFESSGPGASGRFVPLAPQPVARLIPETDGREADFSPFDALRLPTTEVGSVLLRIRADVGADGGMVRLGPDPEALTNTMMWSMTSTGDRTRTGLAIVPLDEAGRLALAYNGGTVLDVDLLGYFTNELAPVSSAGLFVPIAPRLVFDDDVRSHSTSVAPITALLGSDLPVGAVALNVTGVADEPGELVAFNPDNGLNRSPTATLGGSQARGGFATVSTDERGLLALFSDTSASVAIEVTGYFLAEDG